MTALPVHVIFDSGRRFLRLKVIDRIDPESGRTEYCAVLEGDAATKELSLWTDNRDGAMAAFAEERTRYK